MKRIRVHTLTDGRDTEDGTSVKFMAQLQKDLKSLEGKGCDAQVASGGGRMITTMDRYEVRVPPDTIHFSFCTPSYLLCRASSLITRLQGGPA